MGQTARGCRANNAAIGSAYDTTLGPGWNAAALADFNRDDHPDYLLLNPSTGQTAIWYLNNNVRIGSAFGSTLWSGWNLVAPWPFAAGRHPQIVQLLSGVRC